MPELPDILAYLHALDKRVRGQKLVGLRIISPFVLRTVAPGAGEFAGRTVLGIERIGKRIVFAMEGDHFIVVHLMISGRFHWKSKDARIGGKMNLAAFEFTDGIMLFTEASSKKRASIHLVEGRENLAEYFRGGIEPLESTLAEFVHQIRLENHTIKRTLTDPRMFSGIGNAYSDEILHAAHLSPVKLTSRMTDEEIEELFHATQSTLTTWVHRLVAEADRAFPEKVTAFRPEMKVHGKYGISCPDCGSAIQRIAYAENEANYCATCQTGGKLLADRGLSRLLKSDWPRTIAELEERRRNR